MANCPLTGRKKESNNMAFTRKALKELGISEELLDKVMTLHGTSMADYQLKAEFDASVQSEVEKQVKEKTKVYEGVDVEALKITAQEAEGLKQQLEESKFNYKLENRLIKEGAVNVKAVMALIDKGKIKLEGEDLKGIDDVIKEIKTSDPWTFPQPKDGGMRQGNPPDVKTDDQKYLDEKYAKNPYYKK